MEDNVRTLEYIYENADPLSQEVIGAWELGADPEFRELLELACQYQSAKQTAENRETTIALVREQTNQSLAELDPELESVRQQERIARKRFAEAFQAFHFRHERVRSLDGPGKLTFRTNEIADVVCSTDNYGRVRVRHATGYPGWNPILLLHPAGPYKLRMDDGREAQIRFRNLDGLVEVVRS